MGLELVGVDEALQTELALERLFTAVRADLVVL
jgi:hypothetical protein